jgi:kindlin 2
MAHLISDDIEPNDGTWKLGIFVTDINTSKEIYARGDMHIGGVMMKLVDAIGGSRDWSDHALWWPDKRRWLKHTRSTLDQIGVTSAHYLEFTPMHKPAQVQLPDLQLIDANLDFSASVFRVTAELCRELSIRYPEELSLKRNIPPDVLRKGANADTEAPIVPYKVGEESVGPGTLRTLQPIRYSTLNVNGRQSSPALSATLGPGHMFNASEIGTLPRHGTLPRGMSPGPAAYAHVMGRDTTRGFSGDYLDGEAIAETLIQSPRVIASKDQVFRPQNYLERAAINRGWLDSSRSLMEQGIAENEIVQLRFKYMSFFDLNPKYDLVRINQLYEQAKWSILLDEFEHTEEEANLFAALQLQATLQKADEKENTNDKDEVDLLLDELEHNLDAAALNRKDLTHVPELAEYLKFLKPKKLGFNNFKRAYFVFRDLILSYYNAAQDQSGPPLGHFNLKGCEVTQDIKISEQRFHIKILIPSSDGMNELILKCDSESQYAKWLAACKLASRGKTMADSSYNSEVESLKRTLMLQSGKQQNGGDSKSRAPVVQFPSDFNPGEFVAQHYVKRVGEGRLKTRISDAHSSIKNLSNSEAKLQYIRTWESLKGHGLHYFIVKFFDERGSKKPELIAVSNRGLFLVNSDNGDCIKPWPFTKMKKWHVNWEIRHIRMAFDQEEIDFKPFSADCKVVHEFIGGYIFVSMRSKDQKQALDEEGFMRLTGGWA